MAEGDRLWTVHDGERIDVPATVAGIRDALPDEQRERFVAEVLAANVLTVEHVVRDWIVRIASEPGDEDVFARLRAEDQGAA
ncbi:hypothetical protein [Streptomyces clavuligerus]|uniref:Uncharacterized protein n=1 Tax=Streptomyces clavuligerus TaxID=1901 RepID=D5SK48_STRCL|nr:hypothetical protein [Streptomyces clavuligerus]ANW22227.1 hypothetical protein BB341_28240 [Streptomyces clavuligerus]AXU17121.1 hypothetical protein D1794_31300 [Streptomyces clavuligerus]EFG04291.1 Hypothetical protein SCLAV_p0805 [Streptomyces clavuligerus]MBY6307234.1 hypothetical protein [Streptomyces clavuligerus]QCS10191.1 hypothetical protein CRV15_31995 [Streptomyces clavuligerus]